jgi:hypothetical protein
LAATLACSPAASAPLVAQEAAFVAEHHPWAGFPAGSWKLVRTVTESLDEHGNVTNLATTDTRTTLVAVNATSYTLRTDATVESRGRRLQVPSQTTGHGYYGEAPGQAIEVKQIGEGTITIEGRTIPCQVRQVTIEADGVKRTSTIHYSPAVPPYILRRESTVVAAEQPAERTTLVELVSLELPQRVRGRMEQAMYLKTSQTLSPGTKVTLEAAVEDVPGWVVAHWANETDAAGRVVRRSTLELVDYGFPAQPAVNKEPATSLRQRRMQRKAARRMMESR